MVLHHTRYTTSHHMIPDSTPSQYQKSGTFSWALTLPDIHQKHELLREIKHENMLLLTTLKWKTFKEFEACTRLTITTICRDCHIVRLHLEVEIAACCPDIWAQLTNRCFLQKSGRKPFFVLEILPWGKMPYYCMYQVVTIIETMICDYY